MHSYMDYILDVLIVLFCPFWRLAVNYHPMSL